MTQEELARRQQYNRMMNVTARGYSPATAGSSNDDAEWTWSFSEDCPQDFIELFKAKNPKPNFIPNPMDTVHGTWGQVSVWHDHEMGTGYINVLNYDRYDTKTLTFSYDIMKDGETVAYNAFTATALKVNQLKSHLKEIWLDGYDPRYDGLEIDVSDPSLYSLCGACSSVRKGDFHGRNFDFTYDDKQTYLIHVRDTNESFAFNCIVKDMFKTGTYARLLPNMAVDGMNLNGVCVNINVVSKKDLDDLGEGYANVNGTKPGATRVHMLCMPSVILAHATSATHAVQIMQEADMHGDLVGLEYVHFMISDKDDTFVVEVIGDKLHVIGFKENAHALGFEDSINDIPVMTNWYMNWKLFPSERLIREKYTENGCGIERFELLSGYYNGIPATMQGMSTLMKAARFTNEVIMDPATDSHYPFSDLGWGSMWTKDDYLNNLSFKAKVDNEIKSVLQAIKQMDRTKGIWITSHNTTYSLKSKDMQLVFEEDYDHPMSFKLWLRDGLHVEWKDVEWSFDDDCPEDFREMMKTLSPKPKYFKESYDAKSGKVCWGYVSVWSDYELGTGYKNLIHWDSPDATEITFRFVKYVDGKSTKQTCCAVAKKL